MNSSSLSEGVSQTGEVRLPLEYADITKVLPHRYPFLLIDRVVELEPGKRLKAIKNVTANENFFQGHFPEMPVMPGVLQLEAMAQAAALLAYHSGSFNEKNKIAYLMGVDKVKWRRLVVPGDCLELEIEAIQLRRGVCKVKGMSTVNGERACEAIIKAAIRDRPEASS